MRKVLCDWERSLDCAQDDIVVGVQFRFGRRRKISELETSEFMQIK